MNKIAHKNLRNLTPKESDCLVGMCPAIYGVENVTPVEHDCAPLPMCSGIYKGTGRRDDLYLVIGKQVDLEKTGLAGKVSDGEVAIEVPRGIIDGRRG